MSEQGDDRQAILARYVGATAQLEQAIAGLRGPQLDVDGPNNSWSIRQIVHHIVDGDDLWSVAIKAALGNRQSAVGFQWYWDQSQDEWARQWNYAGRDL